MNLHPLHEEYLVRLGGSSVEQFLALLDTLRPAKLRDEVVFFTAMALCDPRRPPERIYDTNEDRFEEQGLYGYFKKGLRELARLVPEELLVAGVVQQVLAAICNRAFADPAAVSEAHRGVIGRARQTLGNTGDAEERQQLQELIAMSEIEIRSVNEGTIESKAFYAAFCDHVLRGLLEESE